MTIMIKQRCNYELRIDNGFLIVGMDDIFDVKSNSFRLQAVLCFGGTMFYGQFATKKEAEFWFSQLREIKSESELSKWKETNKHHFNEF